MNILVAIYFSKYTVIAVFQWTIFHVDLTYFLFFIVDIWFTNYVKLEYVVASNSQNEIL